MSVWNMSKVKKNLELRMTLFNAWTVAGMAAVMILCTISSVYYGESGISLSIIQVFQLLQSNPESVDSEQLQLLVILQRIPSGYLSLFAPVVTSLPFVLNFHAEKMTKYKRVYMFRKKSCMDYYIKKWLAGIVAGGVVMVFGIVLFQILLFLSSSLLFAGSDNPHLIIENDIVAYLKYYAGIFLYGVMSSMLSIVICFLWDNLYFIICLPFVLTYLYNIGVSYLLSVLYGNSSVSSGIAGIIENMFSFSYIHILNDRDSAMVIVVRMLFIFCGVYWILKLYNKSKLDCGD